MDTTQIIIPTIVSICMLITFWRLGAQYGIKKSADVSIKSLDKIVKIFELRLNELRNEYKERLQYGERDPLDSDVYPENTLWVSKHCHPQKLFVRENDAWIMTAELFPTTPSGQ